MQNLDLYDNQPKEKVLCFSIARKRVPSLSGIESISKHKSNSCLGYLILLLQYTFYPSHLLCPETILEF